MSERVRLLPRIGLALTVLSVSCLLALSVVVHAAPNQDGIIYVVQVGDRLVDIAERHGVTASAIVRANNLSDADIIVPGQRLVIPSGATSTPTVAATPTARLAATYIVKLGDTLASIGRKYGISADALQQANKLITPNSIWAGQTLKIPAVSGSMTPTTSPTGASATLGPPKAPPTGTPTKTRVAPSPTPENDGPTIHTVMEGETLAQLAVRYGVSVEALVSTNGLGSADLIGAGTRLIIPAQGESPAPNATPSGRATKFVASISQQRCWLYNGDTVIARWTCSTGRDAAPSVPGTYKIQSKIDKAYGSAWDIWMPFWLGIYWAGGSENGIHGLPWDAETGVQIWSGNVGMPITFGCIMLDNVHAKMLYDMAYIGMPVVIRP